MGAVSLGIIITRLPEVRADHEGMQETSRSSESALVLPGINAATYQCLRSLGRRGVRTIAAADDGPIPGFTSKYCHERVAVPSPDEDFEAYRNAVLAVAKRPEVATAIPCREVDAYLLSKYREAFTEHVSLVVPSFDVLERVHDRVRLAEAAEAAGVPIPETRILDDVEAFETDVVVKSRYNLLTDEYLPDRSPDPPMEVDEIKHVPAGETVDAPAIRETMEHTPIAQEFVRQGSKYMVAALYDHGEPLATFQHKQIRGDSYVGGGGVYRRSVYLEELETVARTLLEHIEWHGLACLEYIQDASTGEFKLLEVNPRMWQSLPSTVRSGADFPYYYWLQSIGRSDRIDPGYELGVGCHSLQGEMGYLVSLITDDSPLVDRPALHIALWDIVRSCVDHPSFDYLLLDDPRPFLQGVRDLLSRK